MGGRYLGIDASWQYQSVDIRIRDLASDERTTTRSPSSCRYAASAVLWFQRTVYVQSVAFTWVASLWTWVKCKNRL